MSLTVLQQHAQQYPGLFDPTAEPVLFYGKEHPLWREFSNFADSPIVMTHPFTGARVVYETVEHWFQACKADNSDDHDWVRSAPTAGIAKRRGSKRGVQLEDGSRRTISLRSDWEQVKFDIMLQGLRAKYQLPRFRQKLLSTENRYLAEDSPRDDIWGWRDRQGGHTGTNLLGLGLMLVRAELRA